MCSITKLMCLMFALHVVQSKERAVLDLEDSQNDDGVSTTLEPSSSATEQSEKARSTSENITSTEETVTADSRTAQLSLKGNEDSTEHAVSLESDKTASNTSLQPTASQMKDPSDEISSNIEIEEQKAKQVSNENVSEDKQLLNKSLEVGKTADDNSFQSTVNQKTISDYVSASIEVSEQKANQESKENDSKDKPPTSKSLELGKTAKNNSFQSTVNQKIISDDVSANIEVEEQKAMKVSIENVSEDLDKIAVSKPLELDETLYNNTFQSTVSQKTTSDKVSENIEVVVQKAKQVSTSNDSENIPPVSNLSRKNSGNESQEGISTTSHPELNYDDIVTIKIVAINDDEIKKVTKKSSGEEPAETTSASGFEGTLESDTADLLNSSFTRRMLGGFVLDSSGNSSKNALPTVASGVDSQPTDNSEAKSIPTAKSLQTVNKELISLPAVNSDPKSVPTDKSEAKRVVTVENKANGVPSNKREGKNVPTVNSEAKSLHTVDNKLRSLPAFNSDPKSVPTDNSETKRVLTVDIKANGALSNNREGKNVPTVISEAKSLQTVNNELRSLPAVNSDPTSAPTVNVEVNKSVPTDNSEAKRVLTVASKANIIPSNNREGKNVPKVNSEAKSISNINSEVKSVPIDNNDSNSVPIVNNKANSLATVNSTAQSIPTVNSDSKSVPIINSEARSVPTVESVPKSVSTIAGQANKSVPIVYSEPKNVPTVNEEAKSVPTFKGGTKSVPIVNSEIKSPPRVNRVAESVPPVNVEAKTTVSGEAKSRPTVNSGAKIVPKVNSKATSVRTVISEAKSASTVNSEPKSVPTVNDEAKNVPQANSEAKRVPAVHSRVKVKDEPTRRKIHNGKHLPPASTTLPSTLPSESHRQTQNWNEPKLDDISTTVSPEVLVPLFRSLRPTSRTLQIQPPPSYQPPLDQQFTTPPIPYKQYGKSAIFQKLLKATQELQHNMAQQSADLHHNQ